jgi:subtilisin-like proprotein convertase family protein
MKKLLFGIVAIAVIGFLSFYVWSSFNERQGIYTGIGSVIKKTPGLDTTSFSINVSGLKQDTLDANFGLTEVIVNLKHQNFYNIDMYLEAPNGERVELNCQNGDYDAVTKKLIFKDNAKRSIFTEKSPFQGEYKPYGFLAWFNNHCNGKGKWRLKIVDTNKAKGRGVLVYWQLKFGNNPPAPKAIESSNLPLVVINCPVISPKKVHDAKAIMKVVYNENGQENFLRDTSSALAIPIELKMRGNSSTKLPRKSYSIKLKGKKSKLKDVSIAGIEPTAEWILGSNLMDRSLIRNPLTYTLFKNIGGNSIESKLCEVIWNNQYMGVYLLSEKPDYSIVQKVFNKEKINTGEQYIVCKDNHEDGEIGWYSRHKNYTKVGKKSFIIIKYPDKQRVARKLIPVIEKDFSRFDDAIVKSYDSPSVDTSYRSLIDMQSFINYMLINELTKNNDGYKLSCFMYKPKNGTLHAGPAWDFDRALGNLSSDGASFADGWNYSFLEVRATNGNPKWWPALMEDSLFARTFINSWETQRKGAISDATINHQIDSLVSITKQAAARNFSLWPVLGLNSSGFYYSPDIKSFDDEINFLRNFILKRAHWIDAHVNELIK